MYCFKCGSPVGEGKKFCANCGAPQNAAETAVQPESAYAAPPPQAYKQPEPAPAPPETGSNTGYTTGYNTGYNTVNTNGYNTGYSAGYAQPQYNTPQPPEQSVSAAPPDAYAASYNPMAEPVYTPPAPAYATAESSYPGYPEYAPAQAPVKKKGAGKLLKIGVPIVAVVAVAVVAVILIFANSSPKATLTKALSGMISEAGNRIDSSPLKVFKMLGDTLDDGKVTVNFSYEDTWYEKEISGKVALSANSKEKDAAVEADLSIYGKSVDAALYIDKSRIAIGSGLIDNKYYGFRYDTFRNDVRSFGDMVGLDDQTMDQMADMVDMLSKMMNSEGLKDDIFAKYVNIVTEFGKSFEMTSEGSEFDSGGNIVKCKKIEFVVTDEHIVKLLNDLYDLMADDDELRDYFKDMFNSSLMGSSNAAPSYSDMLKGFRDIIRQVESDFTGEITYSFYVGNRDRLLCMEMNANMRVSGERSQFRTKFDFGSSALDKWVVDVTMSQGNDRQSVKIVWDYKERSNRIENALVITGPGGDPVTLKSAWSPDSGNFTFSYEDSWGDTSELTGVFTTDGKGFRLLFNNIAPEYSNVTFTIELIGESGASIKQIDYVNIDKWDESLIEKIQNVAEELS